MRRSMIVSLGLVSSLLVSAAGAQEEEGSSKPFSPQQKEILNLLRENRQVYGDDAALLQGLLLVNAIHSDAILPTECGIVGFEEFEGHRFVSLRMDSGIVFETRATSAATRLESVWHSILERTLVRYPAFSAPADGLAVEIRYSHRPYDSISQLYETIDDPGTVETAKFYIEIDDLGAFLSQELRDAELIDRSTILLEGEPISLVLHQPIEQWPQLPVGYDPAAAPR